MRRQILIAKSGISNHAADDICDDPCLSKFGALRGSCPHPGRQFVGLLCVPYWHQTTDGINAIFMSNKT